MPKIIWTPNTKKIWSKFQFLESIFSLFTSFQIAKAKEQSHAQPWLCYGRGHSQKNEGGGEGEEESRWTEGKKKNRKRMTLVTYKMTKTAPDEVSE